MAVQAGTQATPLSPQLICNAFVQQYYHILHETPDQAHKFYQDGSSLGRADCDGVMEYATTLPEISRKIMSMNFSNYLTEIETADTLLSHKDGVLIVVTGSLTMSPDVRRRFAQTFFLAPQESGGYFVLSDILRLIVADRLPNEVVNQENEGDQNGGSNAKSDPTPVAVAERQTTGQEVVENNVADGEVLNPTVNGTTVKNNPTVNGTPVENSATVEPPVQVTEEVVPQKTAVAASPPLPAQKDVTKKSYASIVKVMKEGPPTTVVKSKQAPKPVTKAVEGPDKSSVKPPHAGETILSDKNVTKNNTFHDEQGYSVYIRGLPFNATVKMVEEEFKKYGAVKPGGIQVRNNKTDGFCFGFVEFESQQSMQTAIKESPIFFGEKKVSVEEKRTPTRVVDGIVVTNNAGGGGRFQSSRGAYRGDNSRGPGGGYVNNANYRGGVNFNRRNDGDNFNNRNESDNFNPRNESDNINRRNDEDNFNRRNEFRNRNEFAGRGRGQPQGNGYHHNGNGFHQPRPFQNENGRFARVNGPKQTPVVA